MSKLKKVLIIDRTLLPKELSDDVSYWLGFSNDCMLELTLDGLRMPKECDGKLFSEQLEEVDDYDSKTLRQCYEDGGSLEHILCLWIEDNFDADDLREADKIIIDICW